MDLALKGTVQLDGPSSVGTVQLDGPSSEGDSTVGWT